MRHVTIFEQRIESLMTENRLEDGESSDLGDNDYDAEDPRRKQNAKNSNIESGANGRADGG